tara:strand:- start:1344 stop:1544 length:201 start_codon:yes stop_codon:yes gene_type:complete
MLKKIEKGDRVEKSPMWKYEKAVGTVIKSLKDGSCFIKWDNINGEWYFTEEQMKDIKKTEESSCEK